MISNDLSLIFALLKYMISDQYVLSNYFLIQFLLRLMCLSSPLLFFPSLYSYFLFFFSFFSLISRLSSLSLCLSSSLALPLPLPLSHSFSFSFSRSHLSLPLQSLPFILILFTCGSVITANPSIYVANRVTKLATWDRALYWSNVVTCNPQNQTK